MTLFFDLDGPILDVSDKYYRVYSDILREMKFVPLDKKEYWEAKKNKIPDSEILEKSSASHLILEYIDERKKRIETPDYIKLDKLQKNAELVLNNLSQKNDLILVTLRNSKTALEAELEHLNLNKYIKAVLSSSGETSNKWEVKKKLVTDYFQNNLPQNCWFIGDTETDILTGKSLDCKTVAVANGIRSKERLMKAEPDFIIDDIVDILDMIGIHK
jgi:phosphoglycolate phosphatase-like HAD superfamily hydrolase